MRNEEGSPIAPSMHIIIFYGGGDGMQGAVNSKETLNKIKQFFVCEFNLDIRTYYDKKNKKYICFKSIIILTKGAYHFA